MRTSVKILSFVAAAAFVSGDLGAASPVGAPFLLNPISVRQVGMAGMAVGGNDALRAWSNPALLSGLAERGEIAASAGSMAGGVQSVGGLGGAYRFTEAITAGAYYGFDNASFRYVDAFGDETGSNNEMSSFAGGIAGAYKWRMLSGGIAVKAVKETVYAESPTAIAADIGMAGDWMGFTGALSILNLGGAVREADDYYADGVSLPMEVRTGLSYLYTPLALTGALEFRKSVERDALIGLGVDWWAVKWCALRTGMVVPTGDDELSFTFGLTALWRDFGFDYGLVTQPMGLTNKVAVTWYYGRGWTPPAAPAPIATEKPVDQAVSVATNGRLNLAVSDLAPQGVSGTDAAVIADLLRAELVRTNAFNIVEKQNMDKVLAEHAFQQTGCTSEECAVKLGKLLNVQRMAVGSFGKLMESYILSIRVIDVETGSVPYADSVEGKTVGDLRNGVKDLAARMAKQIK